MIKDAGAMKRHAEGLLWLAWLGCAVAAALSSQNYYLPVLTVAWAATTLVVVPLHFLKAWRRLRATPNKAGYAMWVVFQALCALGLIGGLIWMSVSGPHSPAKSRERVLRSNLQTMRSVIDQYTIDHQKRPRSLDELVAAGYLREIPTDPITKRNDSWDLQWSNDAKNPGIVNLHNSSQSKSTDGSRYCDW
jgi:general secretion pathway protein G